MAHRLGFELFWRFLLVSLVAFGGGQSVLPLVERMAVREAGWVSEEEFAAALGSSYLTPGPILMMAAFIGYRVDGLAAAGAATLGAFLMPWLIAAAAARLLKPVLEHPWLRAFSRGAAAAVVGLQAVIAFDLARHIFGTIYIGVALVAFALSVRTRIHPFVILLGGVAIGAADAWATRG